MSDKAKKMRPAQQCNGSIVKLWPGHRACLSRRQCRLMTRHESGYCIHHRVVHTTERR